MVTLIHVLQNRLTLVQGTRVKADESQTHRILQYLLQKKQKFFKVFKLKATRIAIQMNCRKLLD